MSKIIGHKVSHKNHLNKFPKGKWFRCRPCQKTLHAAEERSNRDAYGLVFRMDVLYQAQPMLWAYLKS